MCLEEQPSIWLPACVCLLHYWPRRLQQTATEAIHENFKGSDICSVGNSDLDNCRRDACADPHTVGSIRRAETTPSSGKATEDDSQYLKVESGCDRREIPRRNACSRKSGSTRIGPDQPSRRRRPAPSARQSSTPETVSGPGASERADRAEFEAVCQTVVHQTCGRARRRKAERRGATRGGTGRSESVLLHLYRRCET